MSRVLTFRKLARGETDHEVIWPIVSGACLALAVMWLWLRLPIPRCGFHVITGLPCPACGATRSVVALLHGDFVRAWQFNPIVFLVIAAVFAFDLYALAVLPLRGPRLRFAFSPSFLPPRLVRFAITIGIAMNWAYLIHRGDI